MLKAEIATTSIIKHFDPYRISVIVFFASKWAVSATLLQEYDVVYWPVTFVSLTINTNEIKDGMVEKRC